MEQQFTMPAQKRVLSYDQWCTDQERFYTTMPQWYWSPTKRMETYHAYEANTKAWNADQVHDAEARARFLAREAVRTTDDPTQAQDDPS